MFLGFNAASEPRGPGDDFWYMAVGAGTAAGVRVTPELALKLTTVYACVKVLAETVAQLPLILYRRIDRGKERATQHPLYRLVGQRPNDMHTSFEWREMLQAHLAMRGNAYSEIVSQGMRIAALNPLHPDYVRAEDAAGSWRYFVRDTPGGPERMLRRDQMLHLRGLASSGIMGLNPIESQREAIGFGLAAQEHGARFYNNGAIFPGWIKHPTNFKDAEAKDKFRAAWRMATTGGRKFETPVLEYGMEYHEIPIKHTDAQYLETLKHREEVAARIFRMPPHKVGILERATNNNIEHQGIEFVTDTLMPWLKRWEQRLNESLLSEDEQPEYFFEFLVDGLLRGDAKTRSMYYNKGVQDGWLTRNEVRELENRNPLPGLDEPLEPLNMTRAADRNADGDDDDDDGDDKPRRRDDDDDRAAALQVAAAERVVNKEVKALKRAAKSASADDLRATAAMFYPLHVDYVVDTALAPRDVAERYCAAQLAAIRGAIDADGDDPAHRFYIGMLDAWESTRAYELATLIRNGVTE